MTLAGKKIILGVTGSIAAYKAVFLLRRLIEEGADVTVVMTRYATNFVAPLTFQVLSKSAVLYDSETTGSISFSTGETNSTSGLIIEAVFS